MKIVKYGWVPTEVEVPFDIEHLKDTFEDITSQNNGKVDFTDEQLFDMIDVNTILSEDEIKQLPKLYKEWYSKDEKCQCKEEIKNMLDALYEKYPNANIEACINDYFD